MAKDKPDYYIIIPPKVRYDSDISMSAKVLYGEIVVLANKNGYCFATNTYLAQLYNTSNNSISRWLTELEIKEYIRRDVERNEKNEVVLRKIYPIDISDMTPPPKYGDRYTQEWGEGIPKSGETPPPKNGEDNNTSINNTRVNNTSNSNAPFEEFWKIYPNKKSKKKAIKLFEKIIEDKETTFEELIEGSKKYALEVDQKGTPEKYVKHPTTWLSQGCWADDYDIEATDDRDSSLPF